MLLPNALGRRIRLVDQIQRTGPSDVTSGKQIFWQLGFEACRIDSLQNHRRGDCEEGPREEATEGVYKRFGAHLELP